MTDRRYSGGPWPFRAKPRLATDAVPMAANRATRTTYGIVVRFGALGLAMLIMAP